MPAIKAASVLIVDDIEDWRDTLQGLLSDAGYDCQTASSSQEAIDLLSKRTYKLAILDLRLDDYDCDDMGGLEIVNWLQSNCAETKAILLSAYLTLEAAKVAFRSKVVVDIFDKGLRTGDIERLLSLVEEIMKS